VGGDLARWTVDEVRERPGGRSARVRSAALDAVRRQLEEGGYASVSAGSVATRAGVDRGTVGRRWPTRARLVVDALLDFVEAAVPVPATGDLEQDLRQLALEVAAALQDLRNRRLIAALVAARAEDPELNELIGQFWMARFAGVGAVLERADAEGEVQAVVEALVAPLYFRTLVTGRSIDDALIEKCTREAVAVAQMNRSG
jgi:AcrR family transcriptional regulator